MYGGLCMDRSQATLFILRDTRFTLESTIALWGGGGGGIVEWPERPLFI